MTHRKAKKISRKGLIKTSGGRAAKLLTNIQVPKPILTIARTSGRAAQSVGRAARRATRRARRGG